MVSSLKSDFLIDPNIHFLNHGSFGACPRPVFITYQKYQRELEIQPVEFLGRRITGLLEESREALANYMGCKAEDLVYFPNPTTGMNMVVKSLNLGPGDEVLTSNQEYNAMDNTWTFMSRKTGLKYIHHPIQIPTLNSIDLVNNFWDAVNENTKVIFISHLTSETAQLYPVEEICERARAAGIVTIIDGAHIPGHIPVDLETIGADTYAGACHKWLCAPKGSAFLYANKSIQDDLDPLVVSWGYNTKNPGSSKFIDFHEWQGTRDLSAFLTVPAAIQYQEENDWDAVQKKCSELVYQAIDRINNITGLASLASNREAVPLQMAVVELPNLDPETLQDRLYREYKVEVPVYRWSDKPHLRVSVQAYNEQEDIDALVSGLTKLLPELTKDGIS